MNKKIGVANSEEMMRKVKDWPRGANSHLIGIPERE